MFLLDTNAIIDVIRERERAIASRFEAELARGTTLLLSAVVLHELRFGVARSERRERNEAVLDRFLAAPLTLAPFGEDDANETGEIRADLARRGLPIGPYDALIAAQARARGAVLVTRNRREFERVTGLMVTDWMS